MSLGLKRLAEVAGMCPEWTRWELAGGLGFEPRFSESESDVLPLDDPPFTRVLAEFHSSRGRLGRISALQRFLRSYVIASIALNLP